MSYGNRSISHGNSRPGLLGAGPNARRSTNTSLDNQQGAVRGFRGGKPGLLGSAPHYQDNNEAYDNYNDRRDDSYESAYQKQHYKEPPGGDRYVSQTPPMPNKVRMGQTPPMPNKINLKTRRIMENFGLTNSDLEELSQLPEHELSSANFIDMIKELKQRKETPSRKSGTHQSFGDRYERSKSNERYTDYDSSPRYPEERRQEDAFSSFQEKWYSDTGKTNERDQPSSGSILRGSRGPIAKSTRWERDDRQQEQHIRRSPPRLMDRSPPRLMERSPPRPMDRSPPRLMDRSPPRMRDRSPPRLMDMSPPRRMMDRRSSRSPPRRQSPGMAQSRRMSPPPVRRMSPRRASPSPRRRTSPPLRMPKGIAGRGGLLGDPHEPSTQELDMLATSMPRPQGNFRDHREPPHHRNEPPMRTRTPPPLMSLVKRKETMPISRPIRPVMGMQRKPDLPEKVKPNSDLSFPKQHAVTEANIMRREQGRVLYLRYQAGAMGVIREEHLVKLAQPFEKVTNILLVAPANLQKGWYQAFIELAHFDGAAAMLEHYMTRPPSIEGVTLMVQRSKYQNLKLRESQMNRDFDHLLDTKPAVRRRRAMSSSPERGRKRPLKPRRDSSREHEIPKKKAAVTPPSRSKSKENRGSESSHRRGRASEDRKEEKKTKTREDKKESSTGTSEKSDKTKESKEKDKVNLDKSTKSKEESPVKKESEEKASTNGVVSGNAKVQNISIASKLQDEKNKDRLAIIRDNLAQAITMTEELLPMLEDSLKEILSEVTEYLVDSSDQFKELEATLEQ